MSALGTVIAQSSIGLFSSTRSLRAERRTPVWDASCCPLLTVLVGKRAFNEVLGGAQRIAICLAISAVVIQLIAHGSLPWISLVVSISFALYGAIRKKIEADTLQGLFIETLCMAPFALTWLWMTDGAGLGQHGLRVDIFLLLGGIYTTAPLLTYIAAARLLPLKIVGLTSYLGPSLQLLVAQTLLGETIDAVTAASFGLVWIGCYWHPDRDS